MVHVSLRPTRDEDGAVAIIVAIVTSTILFGLGALVVDLGLARDTQQSSQISSDASALAAGTVLYPDDTGTPDFANSVAAAKAYALKNFGVKSTDWTGCVDTRAQAYKPDTNNQCISFDSPTKPTKVRVRMPSVSQSAIFGGVYGTGTYTVGTSARAVVRDPVSGTCSLCFLGSVTTNNTDFTVQAASIAVNGDITSGAQSYWTASNIQVAGLVNGQDPDVYTSSQFTPEPTKTAPFADPYINLQMPSGGTVRGDVTSCNTTIQPGVYGSLHVPSNGTCTLAPGLYVITGLWDQQSNNSTITSAGNGVTLYFTCGTPTAVQTCAGKPAGSGGSYDGKNGDTVLSAGATDFPGFAFIYDRDNTNPINLQGNGTSSSISGAVYAKRAVIEFNGNSAFTFNGGPVVIGGADSVGNTSGIVVTSGRSVDLTSSPGPPSLDQ